jgi:hypothetical protein
MKFMKNSDFDPEHFPLVNAEDHAILMHRDAHFGGQFPIMIDYYRQGGKGVNPDFKLERIEELAALEMQLQQNLAALFLSSGEAQRIADAKEAYKNLRTIYEIEKTKTPYPKLIADLILSEDEEAEAEVNAIVKEKGSIVPFLIDLLGNEELYDPLFPGYGQAPSLAVKCLGKIGDKRAIISLFEAIGQGDFFADDFIFKALQQIGEPAKAFLLKVVEGHPINEDNERAAIALIQFKEDREVAKTCLKLLQDPEIQKDPCLPTYLVLVCEGLREEIDRQVFMNLYHQGHFPSHLRQDMDSIIRGWKSK